MLPMPEPTPPRAMTAMPAPISLPSAVAAARSMIRSSFSLIRAMRLVVHVDRIVEVDAGQDGEHVGLKKADADLKASEGDDECQWRPAAEDSQCHHEAAGHLQHGVTGHHVGEE